MITTDLETPRIEILIVNARRRVAEFYAEQQRAEEERQLREAEQRRDRALGPFKREAIRALGQDLLVILAGEWDVNAVGQALLRFTVNGRQLELFYFEDREIGPIWELAAAGAGAGIWRTDERAENGPPFADRLLAQIGTMARIPD